MNRILVAREGCIFQVEGTAQVEKMKHERARGFEKYQ